MRNKYDSLFSILPEDNSLIFEQLLNDGLVIENNWEDKVAFDAALSVHDENMDISKPLDAYDFKIAQLFLDHGFDLRQHRDLLVQRINFEMEYWAYNECSSPYGEKADGRGSVFLLKNNASVWWLTYRFGEAEELDPFYRGVTALDIAERWQSDWNLQHSLILPYLKTAGCKHSKELTYHERLISSTLDLVANIGDLDDIIYYLEALPVLNLQELENGSASIIKQIGYKLSLPLNDPIGSLEWEKIIHLLIERGLNPVKSGNNQIWLFTYLEALLSTYIHPTHYANRTVLKQIEWMIALGIRVNQIWKNQSVLDLAIKSEYNELIDYLYSIGAQTFENLLTNHYLVREELDRFWILKPDWE